MFHYLILSRFANKFKRNTQFKRRAQLITQLYKKECTLASPHAHLRSLSAESVPLDVDATILPQIARHDEESLVQVPLDRLFAPPGVDFSGATTAASGRVLKGSNIVLGPYARDSQVTNAEFVKSSIKTEECPSDGLPEFALVVRSNVGKSSLLNSLVRRKRLAHTSKKPGKTQCINRFRINDSWYLVDLPGYGYAAAPQEMRVNWDEFTKNYFINRETLVSVFLLIDASIPAKKIDLEYASWLGQNRTAEGIDLEQFEKTSSSIITLQFGVLGGRNINGDTSAASKLSATAIVQVQQELRLPKLHQNL